MEPDLPAFTPTNTDLSLSLQIKNRIYGGEGWRASSNGKQCAANGIAKGYTAPGICPFGKLADRGISVSRLWPGITDPTSDAFRTGAHSRRCVPIIQTAVRGILPDNTGEARPPFPPYILFFICRLSDKSVFVGVNAGKSGSTHRGNEFY